MNAGNAFRIIGSIGALWAMTLSTAHATDPITEVWYFDRHSLGVSSGTDADHFNYTYEGTVIGSGNSGSDVKISGWYAPPGNTWQNGSQYLEHYSGGMGMDRPNDGHVLDNGGSLEFVAFEFEVPVTLEWFMYGYIDGDADTTIMYLDTDEANFDVENTAHGSRAAAALTNPATQAPTSGSSSLSPSLLNEGWRTVGGTPPVIELSQSDEDDWISVPGGSGASEVFSYVWAIGASFFDHVAGQDGHWDAVKLQAIVAKTEGGHIPPQNEGVPVPATAALMALGFFLVRRRTSGFFTKHNGVIKA